ncbi:MAG: precorrin-2 C(20)-methyltransferase [Negativicutes bacterium]|nr:precorrin-2 C(20)-methyltransferase [Negativicutes bacterium]
MTGVLYGVGVGPGDPELMTLKAIKAIKAADVIIAPKTEKKEDSVALTIATPYLKEGVQILKLVFPMVFVQEELNDAWVNNKNTILGLLAAGKKVVFLTLGDPMFYSTFIYIYKLLQGSGYPIESIPGVTAFCAIGSKLGYPLAEGNDVLSIIPATASTEKISQALATADNVVLMKVYKNLDEIVRSLEKHDLLDNATMISRCGLVDETITRNLADGVNKCQNYLSTIVSHRSV